MVQALVNISEHTNRVLNVIKAKNGLRDKSQAIDAMASRYEEELMEPEFRPEFVAEVKRILKGKSRKIKSLDELLE
ncbi:MAG TPA: DUF2683 family protein [Candidatus Norongarragalinales archaeon]|nr:DUF2683 family protein [Candidatus Norongarragalinales archaeon]